MNVGSGNSNYIQINYMEAANTAYFSHFFLSTADVYELLSQNELFLTLSTISLFVMF
jgi:N-acetylmuramoyl-L-alanine amidase CwlA